MTVTFVYLRHADDRTSTSYKQDPEITREGRIKARKITPMLIRKFGYPNEIHFSPFLRTIGTLKSMLKVLRKDPRFRSLILVPDSRLSRYFIRKEREKPSVSPETLKFGIPINERNKGFKLRVKDLAKDTLKSRGHGTIWIITHALIMTNLAEKFRIPLPDILDFLEYFTVETGSKDRIK